jgi:hypothetical protein
MPDHESILRDRQEDGQGYSLGNSYDFDCYPFVDDDLSECFWKVVAGKL